MRETMEIRDSTAGQRLLLAELALARGQVLSPARVRRALSWTRRLLAEGRPAPHAAWTLDLGDALLHGLRLVRNAPPPAPEGVEGDLLRRYEDYVLGRIDAEPLLERAADAVLGRSGEEQERSIAYVIHAAAENASLPGVSMSPAALATLCSATDQKLAQAAADAWRRAAADPDMLRQTADGLETTLDRLRQAPRWLQPADLVELESGVCLQDFGERLALRQVVQAAQWYLRDAPRFRATEARRGSHAAAHLLQEDAYPVGGFTSLTNRGTMESLVRSELAYMERGQRPDLFDVRYARDELLYYARDENQFTRRRSTFFFLLEPELIAARWKDDDLPWQRMVLLLGMIRAAISQLTEWLREEALAFIVWFRDEEAHRDPPLQEEWALLEILLQQELGSGIARLHHGDQGRLEELWRSESRRALCRGVALGTQTLLEREPEPGWLNINAGAARPAARSRGELREASGDSPAEDAWFFWRRVYERLLTEWIA